MDAEHRNLMKKSLETLAKRLDIEKLKPHLLSHKIFTLSMIKDLNTVADLFQELPTRGPKAYELFIEVLIDSGYEREANIIKNLGNSHENVYTLKSKPLGYCLIINNVDFATKTYRAGSDRDAANFEAIFQKIGYSVENKRNMKATEMFNNLKTFSKKDFSSVDSCIVCILTHGTNLNNLDILFGIDGMHIYKDNVINLFSNKNCESLIGKPKIFFFVSCRGQTRDYGVAATESRDRKSCTADRVIDAISTDSFDGSKISSDACAWETLHPTFSDVFIVYSTLPYHVSILNDADGSWCIQEFVNALTDSYHEKDLETIVLEANEKVMKRESEILQIKQAFEIRKLGPSSKKIMFC